MKQEQAFFDPVYRLLALAAGLNYDERHSADLRQAVTGFSDWDTLVREAENHAVAPLLYTSMLQCGVDLPKEIKRKLYALVQRHRWANHARASAMAEISSACSKESIPLIVLKGSYLAHVIYPDPSLRTMSDIDLLTSAERAADVQQILRDLGYTVPELPSSKYMADHHHLPGAHSEREGLHIHVEIHHDALSGDAPASITTENLTVPLREFSAEGVRFSALGHQDQLRHLYHHMSEPATRLKLIWCVDIVYFASHFESEINWPQLSKIFPQLINALRLVDYIIPLPENLRPHIPPNTRPMPAGTGVTILPLSNILHQPVKQRVKALLYPSNWWLRLYYGIPPESSLLFTRWLHHPMQVLRWISRRIRASRH